MAPREEAPASASSTGTIASASGRRGEGRQSQTSAKNGASLKNGVPAKTSTPAVTRFDAKARRSWGNLTYTTRMTITFALVAAMTALVAFGGLSWVWEQHFQTYTRENIQRIATTTAQNIGARYERTGGWYNGALDEASAASGFSGGLGVQVTDKMGSVLYDTSRIAGDEPGTSLAPTDKQKMTSAPIYAHDQVVGTVRVWVYGSNTLLTQADQEFRDRSYHAMIIAGILAVALALVLGYLFARTLVNPINRISKAAQAFGEGDLTARTGLYGDDEIAQLGMTFDDMAESVEKDRELERRLTTDVAHELRTPLMAIQSTVEAMIDGVFEPDAERLDTVNSEVQRLSRLVDAILKLSRLESRNVPLDCKVINVGDLISGLVATHEAFVHDSGLTLKYTSEDDVYIYGDADMIRQATANLISNAVRYTDEGTITVSVNKGETMAYIAVADTGIGLTNEEAKMVFSRFWRADAGRTREKGGLGIGLSVVKEIVDQHGGWVRVEGRPNEGATFTMYIPLYNEERIRGGQQRARRPRPQDEVFDDAWDD